MLTLVDLIQGIKNPELKASLSALRDVSPEMLLNEVIQAYLVAQKNHNVTENDQESPNYVNTIMKISKQPIRFDENKGIAYQDDVITVRLRSIFGVDQIVGIFEATKGIS